MTSTGQLQIGVNGTEGLPETYFGRFEGLGETIPSFPILTTLSLDAKSSVISPDMAKITLPLTVLVFEAVLVIWDRFYPEVGIRTTAQCSLFSSQPSRHRQALELYVRL